MEFKGSLSLVLALTIVLSLCARVHTENVEDLPEMIRHRGPHRPGPQRRKMCGPRSYLPPSYKDACEVTRTIVRRGRRMRVKYGCKVLKNGRCIQHPCPLCERKCIVKKDHTCKLMRERRRRRRRVCVVDTPGTCSCEGDCPPVTPEADP